MSIIGNIIKAFVGAPSSVPLFPKIQQVAFSSWGMGKKNGDYYRDWVYACVKAIKDECAKIDLVLEHTDKQGNTEVIHAHPALNLLEYVNEFFTKYTLFERLAADLELYGDHYWLIETDGSGVPISIYPLLSPNIKAVPDPHNYVSAYKYTIGTHEFTIPAEKIVHFKTYNPDSFVKGISTLEAMKLVVDTDTASKEYNKTFYKNNALPSVVLEYPNTLSVDAQKAMREGWDEQFRGLKNAWRTAVAAGGLKVHNMEAKKSDMQFIEEKRLNRDDILAGFGVPATILGINEATVYAAAKAAEYAFARFTIDPKNARVIDTLNEFFLPLFKDSEGLKFKHISTAREDVAEKTAYYTQGINNGWLSLNDVRRAEQLPEIENGETVFLPFSLQPYGQPVVKKEAPALTIKGEITVQKTIESAVSDAMGSLRKAFAPEKKEATVTDERPLIAERWTVDEYKKLGEARVKNRDLRGQAYEGLVERTALRMFEFQKEKALAELEKLGDVKAIKAAIPDLLDYDLEVQATVDLFTPVFGALTAAEGRAALEAIGLLPDTFSINTPSIQEFLKRNTTLFAGTVTQTTTDGIRAVIAEGLEAGEAIPGIRGRIESYAGFNRSRANMIARTETIRAQGEAEIEAWKETRIVSSVVWYTAGKPCDYCAPMHGKDVSIGSAFMTDDDIRMMGLKPYGGVLQAPPLHPNCRCVLIPIVDK